MEQPAVATADPAGPDAAGQPSVLRLINQAHRRLEGLLFRPRDCDAPGGLPGAVLDVARQLSDAAARDPDISLACILLNQQEGTYAVRHCIDTAIVACLVGRALQKGPHEVLTMMAAALTMNIGMLQQQEQLQSRLSAISRDELAIIHQHPQRSADMLRDAGVDDAEWLSYVLMHHENEDGSGYPSGVAGAAIPLPAKVISLADRYCARVSTRSYRKSLLPNEALSDILLADQRSVDPMLTACFIRVLGVYPIGAVVGLASGELAVVSGRGRSSTEPIVQAIVDADGRPLARPVRRDTAQPAFSVREMLSEDQAGVRVKMQFIWGDAAAP